MKSLYYELMSKYFGSERVFPFFFSEWEFFGQTNKQTNKWNELLGKKSRVFYGTYVQYFCYLVKKWLIQKHDIKGLQF